MGGLKSFFESIYHVDLTDVGWWRRMAVRFFRFWGQVFSEFGKDRCATMASGLAHASLLALADVAGGRDYSKW